MKLTGDEAREYVLVPKNIPAVTSPAANVWGWLPVLSLTGAVGVFLLALAAEAGRVASHWADPLFWLGLLVLFVPSRGAHHFTEASTTGTHRSYRYAGKRALPLKVLRAAACFRVQ